MIVTQQPRSLFCVKRISDYYHHPYDVVTGALVGIMFASSTLLVMADVFNKRFLELLLSFGNMTPLALCRSAFWKSLDPGEEKTVIEVLRPDAECCPSECWGWWS